MKQKEKAMIILEELDKAVQVDWNMQRFYLEAIESGLAKIDSEDKKRPFNAALDGKS